MTIENMQTLLIGLGFFCVAMVYVRGTATLTNKLLAAGFFAVAAVFIGVAIKTWLAA